MEQKFTFKRLLSLIVVFTMLFSTFAILAVPAGAEVDVFWAEGDYEIAENGNYSAKHAYGYVFNITSVNTAIKGEDAVIITNNTAYEASNCKWAAHVLLAPTEEANVYEIVKAIPYAGGSGAQAGYDQGINFEDGKILMLVHSSASYPAFDTDGVTIKYPNWESKVAAIALANTLGAKVTLAGIDLTAGTATNATITVQDAPIAVTGENGLWQAAEGDFGFAYDYYTTATDLVVKVTVDDEDLVASLDTDTTGNGNGINVRLWVNYGAAKWDRLYDGFIKGEAAAIYSKDSASVEGTAGTVALDDKTFTFVLPLDEVSGGNDEFQFTVCVSNTESYKTNNACLYAPCTTMAWSAWDAENAHTIVLPVVDDEEDDEEDEPAEPEQHDILVSHVNAYTWGVFNSMVIYGADQNCVTALGYDCQWWIAIKVDDVDGVLTVTDIEGSGDAKENKATEGGFILYVYSNDATSWAAAALVEVGDVLLNVDFDYTKGAAEETPIGTMSFGPAREEEPDDDEDLVELPEDAIVLDYAGYVHDSFFMIVAGDNMTVADLTALGIGSAKDMNYCYVAVVDADNTVIEMYTTLGRPDGVKSDVVCPEGGYLLVLNANKAGADALLAANVGDTIELYNIDVDSFRGAEGSLALESAGFVIVPAEEDEPVDDTPYDIGLNFDFEDNVVVGGEDAAKDLLTDGDYALDAEGWGGNHDGVVLIQNVTATSTSESWATLVYKFEGTPDYYNTIKLGLYSDVNSMIGYPTEDDVYFSNDGVNWVSGYFTLGYGETIPDAYTTLDEGATPTAPGTVVAKIMLENPQNYRFVKIDFYFPKSPFTEANGYESPKPRWEFFGLTEIEFCYEEPSSIITDFNITEYWESRYGRGAGSFGFTTAEAFQIAWDNFITSSYKSVVFAPVEGEDSVYEIIEMANGNITSFPEGGFVWSVYTGCEADSPAAAAIDLFATMAVGDSYKLTGFDFENLYVVKEATIEKVEATTPDPEDPSDPVDPEPEATNVALGKEYTISGCGVRGSYYANLTDGNAKTTLSYNSDEWFGFYCNGEDQTQINAPDKVGYAIIDLAGNYDISSIHVNVVDNEGGSGISKPTFVKAYLSADNVTWGEAIDLPIPADTTKGVAYPVMAEVEGTARFVKIEIGLAATFAFINEIEVYGVEATEEDDEPAYKEGLTIEIDDTLVGWIGDAADLETIEAGLTDGNWGAGDAGDWSNASGIYPFMNKVCTDNTQFPEVNLIFNFGEATQFNTIDLGVYSSYNVMIGYPSALVTVYTSEDGIEWGDCYEAYLDMDIPEIGNEGSVKATAKLATALEAQFVKVVLTFPESPFESKPVWEFMGLTEIELSYVPVTSNVVTDFNPTSYGASIGGATGAFIYDDADIYAACKNDWWIHVAFAPVADMDGYYEVVAVRAPTTGNYLTIPENGFVWMAWSSAGDTPESAGAYALAFMSNLKVGDIVEFVGVDFANHITEADAYAEVWIDPNAPVNVALGKDYTLSGAEDTTYNANLTDGNAYAGMSYDNKWFVFNSKNTEDGIGYAIIDLEANCSISKLSVNLINETGSGVAKPEFVKFYVSADGEAWEEVGEVELQDVQSAAYWASIEELELEARYVKLEMKIGAPFSFLNEIEVYGKVLPIDVELEVGENNITVPAGTSANATTNFDEDYVIVIENNWSVSVVVNGVEYYPNRGGYLEAPLAAGENTVEFKNGGEDAAEIVVNVTAPVIGDTMDDPIVIEDLGDFTAEVTDKYPEGVYYEFVATEDGFLTITINSEDGWMYVINNVTAGKYGDNHWSDDEEVVASETIEVKAGDVIAILVATYDPENPWSAPAGSVDFTLGTPAGEDDTIEYALGDVNMDGKVDQYDYILVKRHYFGTRVLTGVELELADVNNDDVVDQYDYILLCRHYFGTFTIEGTVEVAVEAE